jgi:hypothetical protein
MGKEKTFVKDGYHFVDMLKSRFYMHKRGFQVSLDVTALFPSLLMEEALVIFEKETFRRWKFIEENKFIS